MTSHPDGISCASPPQLSAGSAKLSARRILAENLRIIRLVRNLSQEALADLSGLDRSYLGDVERAERNLSLDKLEKLAHALEITIPDLLREPDPYRIAQQLIRTIRETVNSAPKRTR